MSDDKLYAILSDIHGNQEAFATVLAYLKGLAVEEIFCLGDLVGYGQGASDCVRMARRRGVTCIQGNHDAQVRPPRDPRMRPEAFQALDLAMDRLDEEQIDWLARLPEQRIVDNRMVLVHGALTGRDDYILTAEAVHANKEILRRQYAGIQVGFFGHTHLGMVIGGGRIRTKFPDSTLIDLDPSVQYLINPGSVGQPRDGNPLASFAIYDPAQHQLTMVRLEYNVELEQERMREAGLPSKLWQRIALGK